MSVVGRIIPLKDVQVLVPRICYLTWQRNAADVMQVTDRSQFSSCSWVSNLGSGVYLRLNAWKSVAPFFWQLWFPLAKSCFAGAASSLAQVTLSAHVIDAVGWHNFSPRNCIALWEDLMHTPTTPQRRDTFCIDNCKEGTEILVRALCRVSLWFMLRVW